MRKMNAPQNANLETLDDEAQGKKYFKGKNVVTKEDGIIYDTLKREKEIEWQVDYNSQGQKKRVMWTPELEQKFKDAVDKLDKEAVPSKIMKLMNVQGLQRHHVASHLQKYRIRQKKEPSHKPAHKPEGYCSRLSPNVPKSVLPEQQGPVMMQPSCNMFNLSPNPPMQMPPFIPFPSQISPSIAATHFYTIDHVQACLDNLQFSSNIQPKLSLGTSSTGMTAHLNEDKDETSSLYDMLDTIPNTTGENVKSSEVIEQAPQFGIESNACFNGQMDTGLITEASNSGILTENDILMEKNFLNQDFDISDFDITFDDLPSFEMLMSTNQFQSLDSNGQQQTDVQDVASNSKSLEDDGLAEELEKLLACDMEFAKMNDQPPPTDES